MDIPQITGQQIGALRILSFPSLGIHKDSPGPTQKPEPLSLLFTQISPLGSHRQTRTPLLGIHTDIPGFTRKTHPGYPRSFFSFPVIHKDIPRLTQKPELFTSGLTQIYQDSQNTCAPPLGTNTKNTAFFLLKPLGSPKPEHLFNK